MHVPTVRHEPICPDGVRYANEERKKEGLEPFVPHPDAYDKAYPELGVPTKVSACTD
jgi:hypothetical protein